MIRRSRKNIIVLVIFSFIIYISYKILKPELSGDSYKDLEARELERLNLRRGIGGRHGVHNHNQTVKITKEDVIKELIDKYTLNWNKPLKDSPWVIAESWVSSRYIHPEYTPELGSILRSLATRRIISADVGYRGTQLKLLLTLEGGQKASFKPRWFTRDHVIQGLYEGGDRHNGEIATFHLGRLLEFRRTPLVVGRTLDLGNEIIPVATKRLADTFFNRDNSVCFYGKCYYCKGPETGICANGTKLEGAVILWLPAKVNLKTYKHPWRRTYIKDKQARWEIDDNFCNDTILISELYTGGRRLMDIVDTALVDYMTGNSDRHLYETAGDSMDALFMLMDNGKSFGNPYHDERSILAPLYQCCQVRESTWLRMLALQDGILSAVLQTVLSQDPIAPVLTDLHLKAMDRRLQTVLDMIKQCIGTFGEARVLIKDK